MANAAIIVENSVGFVSQLLDVWAQGDCAVLIDERIPAVTASSMMREANVSSCYFPARLLSKELIDHFAGISLFSYSESCSKATILPQICYDKFVPKYSDTSAVVLYSSGTTGTSKGVVLSHYAINTNADAIIDYMNIGAEDCLYIVRSMSHSSVLIGELLVALKSKAKILLAPLVVPPRYVFQNIQKYRVSLLCVNPSLLALYATEYKGDISLSSLKAIHTSGSILKNSIRNHANRCFTGIPIINSYGLTEAGPRVSSQAIGDCYGCSVGHPIAGVNIAIVNQNGEKAKTGEFGVIHVFTKSKYSGYLVGKVKHPSIYCDWLNTGDIGYLDENDELYIVGRIDNMLNLDSHKIYPESIENIIIDLLSVDECIVYLNENGTLVCDYIAQNDIANEDLHLLHERIQSHEIPKSFFHVASLPHTSTGKLLRKKSLDCFK